jgi:hypothetical protein
VHVEEEFTSYVAARWGRLVRSAVLLGCSPAEAEDVVQRPWNAAFSTGAGYVARETATPTCTGS